MSARRGSHDCVGLRLPHRRLHARSGLDREHLYVAMSRGREANHVHTTPELETGDAGSHRPAQAPLQAPGSGQLGRPDLDAAVSLLTTAVTTTGRERAAHSLLDPAIAQARERDWERRESQRPAQPVPAEHVRNQRDLDAARARLEQARDEAGRVESTILDLTNQLERVGIGRTIDLTVKRDGHTASMPVDIIDVDQPPQR